MVHGSWFGVWGLGFRASCFVFRVSCFAFRVSCVGWVGTAQRRATASDGEPKHAATPADTRQVSGRSPRTGPPRARRGRAWAEDSPKCIHTAGYEGISGPFWAEFLLPYP
jgi:hypothetical protein